MKIGLFNIRDFLNRITFSFVSVYFIVFLFIVCLFYFFVRKDNRWIVLLFASLIFLLVGGGIETAVIPVLATLIAFFAAISIEGTIIDKKREAAMIMSIVVIVLITTLMMVKLSIYYKWGRNIIFPIGISYYSFSLISYVADVYYKKDKASHNFFKLLLFTIYFPKILQGPIARHKQLANQLNQGHEYSYYRMSTGIQLMIWGYFKKMVIADRLNIVIDTVMSDYEKYGGLILIVIVFFSCIRLYCDFSGCMDIAAGFSEILGIDLPRNFEYPFFSRSVIDFWRKWHITLGAFFRDYVYMPITVSPCMMKLGGIIQRRCGKKTAKRVWIIIPTSIVWILTGVWHGTGINYFVWGLYWGLLIILSTILADKIKKFTLFLRIDTEKTSWKYIQIIRTFILFMIGRIISMSSNLSESWGIIVSFISKMNPWELCDGTIYNLGLSGMEIRIAVACIVFLFIIESYGTKHQIRQAIAKWNVVARSFLISLAIIFILVFGVWGPAFNTSSFAYMNF